MKHVTQVQMDRGRRRAGWRHQGERADVRPRDSKEAGAELAGTGAWRGSARTDEPRVSRVVAAVGQSAGHAAGSRGASELLAEVNGPSAAPEDDVVTAVDGAREVLTQEQQAALARRIRRAMDQSGLDQTLPLGTPAPAPVQAKASSFMAPPPASPWPPASGEAAQLSFKKTMLLGLPRASNERTPSPPPATALPPQAAVRASLVRDIGPPRTPPPRRSRRVSVAFGADRRVLDHDAFQLARRVVALDPMDPGTLRRPTSHRTTPAPSAPGAGLILPPPPEPRDLELPRSPAAVEEPASMLDMPGSSDPFAGFVAPGPSWARRWALGLVLGFALVGLLSLTLLALRWLAAAAL